MDENNKNRFEEKEKENNLDPIDSSDDKKLSSTDKKLSSLDDNLESEDNNDNIDPENMEKEVEKLLKEMEDLLGDNISNVKVVAIDQKQKRKLFIFQVIEVVLSVILLFASIGYLEYVRCEELYQYFILIGGIVLLEYLFKYIIKKTLLKLIILTFGTITILAPILSFVLCLSFAPGVEIISYGLLIVGFIAYLIIKKIFMSFLMGNRIKFIGGIKS